MEKKIYTSYFYAINLLIERDYTNLISIAGKTPANFIFRKYNQLAPKYDWWKEWHDKHLSEDWYINKYNETVLSKLNPMQVYLDLTNNDTEDAVILCYEAPKKFCHRHLVANWLSNNLNILIKEMNFQIPY